MKYLIRTVTNYSLGTLERIDGDFLVLSGASWVADTGRFTEALKSGKLEEVEITNECYVNINAIVDAFPWQHKLPTEQK